MHLSTLDACAHVRGVLCSCIREYEYVCMYAQDTKVSMHICMAKRTCMYACQSEHMYVWYRYHRYSAPPGSLEQAALVANPQQALLQTTRAHNTCRHHVRRAHGQKECVTGLGVSATLSIRRLASQIQKLRHAPWPELVMACMSRRRHPDRLSASCAACRCIGCRVTCCDCTSRSVITGSLARGSNSSGRR